MSLRACIARTALLAGLALAGSVAADDVVAVVNGEPVGRREFGLALVRSLGRSAMETVVDWALVEQEAARQGIAATPEELAARRALEVELRVRAVPDNARMTPQEFARAAEAHGWDAAELRRRAETGISEDALRVHLLAEKMLFPSLDLSEDALRAYYERTRGRRLAAAHVVVRSRRHAEALLEQLEQDLTLWPRNVLERSLDRESVPYRGRMRPVPAQSALGRVLEGMKPGELKLWQEGGLWHVLRFIEEVPPDGEAFDAVRDRLKAELLAVEAQSAFDRLLAALNARATVVVNLAPDPRVRRLLGEEAAAFVDGRPVAASDLAELLVQEFGHAMLGGYVERLLVFQEARRRGLAVPQEMLEQRLQEIGRQLVENQAAQRGMTAEELSETLAGAGLGTEQLQDALVQELVSPDDVRATMLAEMMVADGVEVTDSDVQRAYEALREESFVVKDLSAGDAAEAEQLSRRLSRGGDFDLLARTERPQAGAWLSGSLVQTVTSSHPYYPYAKDLNVGEDSVIFEHDGRYHIIRLVKRHIPSDPPPLDSVRRSLEQQVRLRKSQPRIRAFLVKLKAESDIEIKLD
jgi:hypothetical protein